MITRQLSSAKQSKTRKFNFFHLKLFIFYLLPTTLHDEMMLPLFLIALCALLQLHVTFILDYV